MEEHQTTELAQLPTSLASMPVMNLDQARSRRKMFIDFVESILVEGVDYGTVPGTDKPTLLKPGAEKLSTFFGLVPRFEVQEKVLDWTGEDHGGEPFFFYEYRCTLYRNGIPIADADGNCNSWEKKYRYRQANRVCPNCGVEAIIKGKPEYGGGWLCWAKKGGCGMKWTDGAEEIEGQEVGQVPNPDPADLVNTISKMAQKRSLVGAVLVAVNASEFFTQDIEDQDKPELVNQQQKTEFAKALKSFGRLAASAEAIGVKDIPDLPEDADLNTINALGKSLKERYLVRKQERAKGAEKAGAKFPRPWPAEITRQELQDAAANGNDAPASQDQRGLLAGKLNEVWGGDDDADQKRHSVLLYVWNTDTVKDLSKAQASVMLDWLIESQDEDTGDYILDSNAVNEARLMLRAWMIEQGQQDMFAESEDAE